MTLRLWQQHLRGSSGFPPPPPRPPLSVAVGLPFCAKKLHLCLRVNYTMSTCQLPRKIMPVVLSSSAASLLEKSRHLDRHQQTFHRL